MPATTPAAIARAVTATVTAAGAGDAAAFAEAGLVAGALDQPTLSLVLAGIIQRLLEIRHPDGLDTEDVQAVLTATVRAGAWCPDVTPEQLTEVLVGALGLTPGEPVPAPPSLCRPATLVVATLLPGQPVGLPELIATELAELERAQTMELP